MNEKEQAYKDKTGYEIPEDLKHKKARLKQIKETRIMLALKGEGGETERNPDMDCLVQSVKKTMNYRKNNGLLFLLAVM